MISTSTTSFLFVNGIVSTFLKSSRGAYTTSRTLNDASLTWAESSSTQTLAASLFYYSLSLSHSLAMQIDWGRGQVSQKLPLSKFSIGARFWFVRLVHYCLKISDRTKKN